MLASHPYLNCVKTNYFNSVKERKKERKKWKFLFFRYMEKEVSNEAHF